MSDIFVQSVRQLVGADHVLTHETDMEPYVKEYGGKLQGMALCVIRPKDTQEVSKVVRLCAEHNITITPQGGNTGLVGGSVPYDPENACVLSLDRMTHIRVVDPENFSMTVEAGCVLQTVQETAAAHHLFFPLALGAQGSCRIGGNIASNAGGILTMRYGNTRDLVLGLEVVLPDGSIWNGLRALRKDNTGYDLKQLFIGSEGTLGIITAATLKLFPDPGARETFFAALPSADAMVAGLSELHNAFGNHILAYEIMSQQALHYALHYGIEKQAPLAMDAPWYVLAEITQHTREDVENALGLALESGWLTDAVLAQNEHQRKTFWHLREIASDAAQAQEGGSIKHDISVPIASIPDFIAQADTVAHAIIPNVKPAVFGHAGDGNLHYDLTKPDDMDVAHFRNRWESVNHALHDVVAQFNGSFAAEHGVGIFKASELTERKDPTALALMRQIKHAIDPHDRMNPGVVFPVVLSTKAPDRTTPETTEKPEDILDSLRAIVGDTFVLTNTHDKAPYVTEYRGRYIGDAQAVVFPKTTQDVSDIVKLCARHTIPITPQGGNTGLVGGSIPYDARAIILNLSRMNAIRSMDPDNFSMTVEAGCVLQNIQHEAFKHNRLFPLSLASEGSCRIGGNIASNAGGILTMRYGNTRDLVLGLEVVLPDGSIWNGLRTLRKDNTGYDLKQLFIGSEGTLGIITAATLKLFPDPGTRETFFAVTDDVRKAVTLLSSMRATFGDSLLSFELIARQGLEFSCAYNPQCSDPLQTKGPWYILAEIAQPANTQNDSMRIRLENALGNALEKGLILDATLAQNEQQRTMFWTLRESVSDAQRYVGGSIKHDISVPITAIADFIDEATKLVLGMMRDIRPVIFGHLGDGNLHFNLSQPEGMDKNVFMAQWDDFAGAAHDVVTRYNGSFSAEHGIGTFKAAELQARRSTIEIGMMRALKRAIDPQDLMNSGKVLMKWKQ